MGSRLSNPSSGYYSPRYVVQWKERDALGPEVMGLRSWLCLFVLRPVVNQLTSPNLFSTHSVGITAYACQGHCKIRDRSI